MFDVGVDKSAVTDADGEWTIGGLSLADQTNKVYEVQKDGYTQTLGVGGLDITNPGSGETGTGYDFANFADFSISGTKYEDANGDGKVLDDKGLAGFTIFVDENGNKVFDVGVDKSAVTDADGKWTIEGLSLADQTNKVYEVQKDGYTQTLGVGGLDITNPGSGETGTGYDFANFADFSISGTKYEDANGDGKVLDDKGLAGFTIFVDENGNKVFDVGVDKSAVTDADGKWTIEGLSLADQTNKVYEVQKDGYTQTLGVGGLDITNPGSGETGTGYDFANFADFSISGTKYEDANGDGKVLDDKGLAGFTIFVDENGNKVFDVGVDKSAVTDADGKWTIEGLSLADQTNKVYEVQKDGYTQTLGVGGLDITNPGSGETGTGYDFANFADFSISGTKYEDANGDGKVLDDKGLAGFTIFVDENGNKVFDVGVNKSAVTDADGKWTIEGLSLADDQTNKVYEVQKDGYTQTLGVGGLDITNPGSGETAPATTSPTSRTSRSPVRSTRTRTATARSSMTRVWPASPSSSMKRSKVVRRGRR